MLYHIIAVHEPDKCPMELRPEDAASRIVAEDWAADNQVRLICAHVCGPAHKFYMVVEAQEYRHLVQFLRPLSAIGYCECTPVSDLVERMRS